MDDVVNLTREGKVIDNNDPLKLGRVKVKVYPELSSILDSDLPWASPYNEGTGTTEESGIHRIPEIGAFVKIIVEDAYWQRFRYTTNDYIPNLYIYPKFSEVIISEMETQTYPQPQFQRYEDGTVTFHNTETGETGIYHNSGTYHFLDSEGNYFVNTAGKKIKIYNSSAMLKTIIKSVQEVLQNLVTPLNLKDGQGLPCIYSNVGTDLPKIQQVLVDLNNLMED